jgi:ABC transporter transmembrane protein
MTSVLTRPTKGSTSITGILVKVVLLGGLDALAVFALFTLFMQQSFVVFGIALVVLLAINYIYLKPGLLPAKYLAPGVVFLIVFQIFVVLYSGYIAFTNYGDGHNSTKEDAIDAIISTSQQRVPDSDAYGLTVLEQLGQVSFLVTDPDGDVYLGG